MFHIFTLKLVLSLLFAICRCQENTAFKNGNFQVLQNSQRIANDYKNQRNPRFFFHKYNSFDAGTYPNIELCNDTSFDFIIVGSGSSGSVLANRLSEIDDWSILLLEVGEEATPLTDIPAIAPAFQFTSYDWAYKTEPQEGACLACKDRRMHWPRGRALGGSTIINYMINVRGNRLDYEKWKAMGNPGWGYKDVFPYFAKMEDVHLERQDPGYHQKGGYLSVSDIPWRSKSAETFVQAAQEAGYNFVDYNGKKQMGISFVHANIRRGLRCSGEAAYLRPVKDRKNLKILTKARVVKVLIDQANNTAYGVIYNRKGQYFRVFARKEVILAAGAFNSPQLLMLSGIGPEEHLEELGIPLIKDLPVGKKMFDHLTFPGLNFEVNETDAVIHQSYVENISSFLGLITNGTGPLASLGGVEAIGYFKTKESREKGPYPDMEILFVGGSFSTDKGLVYKNTFSITDELYNYYWKPLEGRPVFMVLLMNVHPKSHGFLKLKSKNPYHWPKFYPNYFTDPENSDIKTFIAGIREIQRIIKSPSMQKLGAKLIDFVIPGCEAHKFDTDAYWECALRHVAVTLHHQTTTCKMGPAHDPEAVVDNKLRVYGVKNLRVVDSSVIPLPLTAHVSVPTYMIGEKASDVIKIDWGRDRGNYSIYRN